MSLRGVKGRMPAYYSTVHDIDTAKQPQGWGGQQGWNVQGKPYVMQTSCKYRSHMLILIT